MKLDSNKHVTNLHNIFARFAVWILSVFFVHYAVVVVHQRREILCFAAMLTLGSLSNHDDDGNKNPINLHIWQWKQYFCTLCTCISHLLTFWRPSRSLYDVKWPVLQSSWLLGATGRTHCFCLLNMETTVPFCRVISVRQLPFAVLSDNVFWNRCIFLSCFTL